MGDNGNVRALETQYLPRQSSAHDYVVWQRAVGCRVWDTDNREYIDFTSGVLVTNVGHCNPHVVEAVRDHVGELINCYDAPHPLRGRVAERLVRLAGEPFDAVALLTTGAEAIDAAVRAARAFTGRFETISFAEGFHGKSYGPMSITGLPAVRGVAGPAAIGSIIVPYPTAFRCPVRACRGSCNLTCLEVAEEVIRTNSVGSVAAIVVEPYLGAGGAYVPPPEFWPRIKHLAESLGALLILDEVQASFGRTGHLFAFQSLGIVPDVLVVAKGIASGMPMSAVLSRREILDALPPGNLWTTYGGNPVSCAACLATLDVLIEEKLPQNAARMGNLAAERMARWSASIGGIGEVRGTGLSLGVDLITDTGSRAPDARRAVRVVQQAADNGVLVLPPAGVGANVVRIAPPLVIDQDDLLAGLDMLEKALISTAEV